MNWNSETKGDVFEYFLGLSFLSQMDLLPENMSKWRRHVAIIADLLDNFIYQFWCLMRRVHYIEGRWLDFVDIVYDICSFIHMEATLSAQLFPSAQEISCMRVIGAPRVLGSGLLLHCTDFDKQTGIGILYSAIPGNTKLC